MEIKIERFWVNQPSSSQTYYKLHGTNVLGTPIRDKMMRIYFLSGNVISMEIPRLALSEGWINVPIV